MADKPNYGSPSQDAMNQSMLEKGISFSNVEKPRRYEQEQRRQYVHVGQKHYDSYDRNEIKRVLDERDRVRRERPPVPPPPSPKPKKPRKVNPEIAARKAINDKARAIKAKEVATRQAIREAAKYKRMMSVLERFCSGEKLRDIEHNADVGKTRVQKDIRAAAWYLAQHYRDQIVFRNLGEPDMTDNEILAEERRIEPWRYECPWSIPEIAQEKEVLLFFVRLYRDTRKLR